MTIRFYPKPNATMRGTPKQVGILKAILRGNPDGSLLDIYQLMDQVGNGQSRGSMTSTLGHLASHGLIERGPMEHREGRGSRGVRLLAITDLGRAYLKPRNLPSAD